MEQRKLADLLRPFANAFVAYRRGPTDAWHYAIVRQATTTVLDGHSGYDFWSGGGKLPVTADWAGASFEIRRADPSEAPDFRFDPSGPLSRPASLETVH